MKIFTRIAVLSLVLYTFLFSSVSYAYTKVEPLSYGVWEQTEDGNWRYGERKWDENGKEYMRYAKGVQIIGNAVYEFTDDGIYINRNQKYYRDKFEELSTAMNSMNDIITMPEIQVSNQQEFWAVFNNRICGSSSGIQFLPGDKLYCTNLDELKFAIDKYGEFSSRSMSYINSLWNKNAPKDKKGKTRELKNAATSEILSLIKKDINNDCVITKDGSRPTYVFTGSSSINSRDVSVAIADSLCRIGIPAVTCSSIETGQLYVCVYMVDSNSWKWCDFTQNGDSYEMNYIPGDLVYYY